VITTQTVNTALQYTLQITDWRTGVELASDVFAFEVPEEAEQIRPDDLLELDELPGAGAGQVGVGCSRGVGVNIGVPVNRVGVR
jgi:hypothetical protein